MKNLDATVVESFGDEWSKFDQKRATHEELQSIFDLYFKNFPWSDLPQNAEGFDLGCGSGRWANFVAGRVGRLYCIDASEKALAVAKQNLQSHTNCDFHLASVDALPLGDSSTDFGYSLGVLHHVPDTQAGIAACVRKLKPGAPFLLYLYYAFDNRPWWFRQVWRMSEAARRILSSMPFALRAPLCEVIAALVYWPLARTAKLAERLGANVESFPLSAYRNRSLYVMRTDALDRFGTRLEQRFTRKQIEVMMERAGLERITFSDSPYWCAVGFRVSAKG